jgi:uncharacterized membrane protein (UPF0127 family)
MTTRPQRKLLRLASMLLMGLGLLLWGAACTLPSGCSNPAGTSAPAGTITVTLGSQPITLEIANTPDAREQGLMFRDTMPADHGMIFIFADERPLSFWMKNTRLKLDLLYLDAQGKVLDILTLYPHDLTGVPSSAPAQYAIELNTGTAERVGLKVGDTIKLPGNLPPAS